jgi:hypothetical protein
VSVPRLLLNVLLTAATLYNLYFFGTFLRSLVRRGRKLITLGFGAAWLIAYAAVTVSMAFRGFAECAGGCLSGAPPATPDWLLSLADLGVGVGFNFLLSVVQAQKTSACGASAHP